MCNVTLWGVCLTSAAKKTQHCVVGALFSYMSLSTTHNIIKLSVITGTSDSRDILAKLQSISYCPIFLFDFNQTWCF